LERIEDIKQQSIINELKRKVREEPWNHDEQWHDWEYKLSSQGFSFRLLKDQREASVPDPHGKLGWESVLEKVNDNKRERKRAGEGMKATKNNMVKYFFSSLAINDFDLPIFHSGDRNHPTGGANLRNVVLNGFNVLMAGSRGSVSFGPITRRIIESKNQPSIRNGQPLRAIEYLEEAMVMAEADQGEGRKIKNIRHWGGPDCRLV